MKCHKCGCNNKKLIHHHKSYEPQVIVLMCHSCHQKLHKKLRKECKCQISTNELNKMSINASNKTYHKNNIGELYFYETMMSNVKLHERIQYNYQSGNITYTTAFEGTNGKKLLKINIEE